MNQKLEAAANDFTHKVGLEFLARKQYNVAVDSFIAGAEWALKEADKACNNVWTNHAICECDAASDCIKEIKQLLSKEK